MADEAEEEVFEEILNILVESGFQSLSMKNIADRCHISKSLLFYHFESKETMLRKFLFWLSEERILTERIEDEDVDPEEMVDIFLGEEGDISALRKALVRMSYFELGDGYEKLNRRLEELIREKLESYGYEDVERRSKVLLTTFVGVSYRIVAQNDEIDMEKKREEIKDIIL